MPPSYEGYIEPFLGGGALWLALQPSRAIVGDRNTNLVELFEVVRDNCEELIELISKFLDTKEEFYRVRKEVPESKLARAARTIYLNLYSFNNLYRENRKGEFNVSYGLQKTGRGAFDVLNLRQISRYLNEHSISISSVDWRELTKQAKGGDFVFLDPPYHSVNGKGMFGQYCKESFNGDDLESLYAEFKRLQALGAKVMLTNSYCPEVLDKFKEFRIVPVHSSLGLSKYKSQAAVIEVIILSY